MGIIIGYLFSIAAAVGFGVQPMLISEFQSFGFSGMCVAWLRSILAVPIFLVIILLKKGESLKIGWKQFLKVAALALTGAVLTATLLFTSYDYIDTGIATALDFCYPIVVVIFSTVICHEKVTPRFLLCLLLCITGITLFCNFSSTFSWKGFILALLSGVTYGFYLFYLDKSKIMNELSFYAVTFYFFLISAVMLLPFVITSADIPKSVPGQAWGLLLLLIVLESIIVVLLQLGISIVGSKAASILGAMEPVTSVALGVLVLGEEISVKIVVGICMILASTIILILKPEADQ